MSSEGFSSRTEREFVAQICRAELTHFVNDTTGVIGAVVSTSDGFDVASAFQRETLSPAKMAAMASTTLALAQAVLQESGFGDCQDVVVEAKTGKVLMISVGDNAGRLLLCVTANDNAVVGQILWASRQSASRILAKLSAIHPHTEALPVAVAS